MSDEELCPADQLKLDLFFSIGDYNKTRTKSERLSAAETAVAGALALDVDEHGRCSRTYAYLAAISGLSRTTVVRAVKRLVESAARRKGFPFALSAVPTTAEEGGKGPNLYTLTLRQKT